MVSETVHETSQEVGCGCLADWDKDSSTGRMTNVFITYLCKDHLRRALFNAATKQVDKEA